MNVLEIHSPISMTVDFAFPQTYSQIALYIEQAVSFLRLTLPSLILHRPGQIPALGAQAKHYRNTARSCENFHFLERCVWLILS